jgi:hypothetical protein
MARPPPPEDPRVTDLTRYRKDKARKKPPRPASVQAPSQRVLGSNPWAGRIILVIMLLCGALWLVPLLLPLVLRLF